MEPITDVPLFCDGRYADLSVGDRWGPFPDQLDQEASDALRGSLTDPAPGAGAPYGALPVVTLRALRRALGGIIPGGVLMRQHFTVLGPLPADAAVETDVWVSHQRGTGAKLQTTFTFTVNHDGRPRALVEWTILAPPTEEGAA